MRDLAVSTEVVIRASDLVKEEPILALLAGLHGVTGDAVIVVNCVQAAEAHVLIYKVLVVEALRHCLLASERETEDQGEHADYA